MPRGKKETKSVVMNYTGTFTIGENVYTFKDGDEVVALSDDDFKRLESEVARRNELKAK